MKIVLTGGGTGGHLIPLLSVIAEIRKKDSSAEFLFIGPKSDFNEALRAEGVEIKEISAGKIRRYFSLQNFIDFFKVFIGTDEAIIHMLKFKPDVIFSKGGFAGFPAVLAASYMRIPILSHESDTVPGLANRIIGRMAKKIFISFPQTRRYFIDDKIIISGNPIREDILHGDKMRAQKFFGLQKSLPVLLVFGGSQGARKINDALLRSLKSVLDRFEVIHVCGTKTFEEIEKKTLDLSAEHKRRYRVYPYLHDEMKDAFVLSDFIVSRAGANSLSEIIALRKPSLVIPLSSAANNHQYQNAKFFADDNLIMMVEEKDLDGEVLTQKLYELESHRDEIMQNLERYNASLGAKKPAQIIAEEIIAIGRK